MLAHPSRPALLLLAVAALPWALGVGNPIQDVDPAQYADVAHQLAQGGGWFDLRDNSGPFVNKPPLSIWAQAVCIKVLGPNSAAARLPAILFALLAVWGTFALGRALLDPTCGAVGACLLAASVSMHQMVADPKVDLALTAMATLSLWAFVEGGRRPRYLWLGWAFTGLAVLAKGPLGLGLAAAAIAPEAIRQRWGEVEQSSLRERLLALKPVRGLLIVAALAGPYYWMVYRRDGTDGASFVLWRQNFGRFLGQSGYQNDTTPFFFLHTALWAFAPFTPLLLGALVLKARAVWRTRALPPRQARVLEWGFCIPFAVFSASDYKLPQYIFVLAPLGALIAAEVACRLVEPAVTRIRTLLVTQGLLGAGLVAWLLVECFPPEDLGLGAAGIGFAVLVPMLAWAISRKWTTAWRVTTSTVASIAAFHVVYSLWIFPQWAGFATGQALATRARREDPQAVVIPFLGAPPTFAVSYYAGVRARPMGLAELKALVVANQAHTAVVNEGAWPDFSSAGLQAASIARFASYPTSRPKPSFLQASSRASVLEWRELVRVTAQ